MNRAKNFVDTKDVFDILYMGVKNAIESTYFESCEFLFFDSASFFRVGFFDYVLSLALATNAEDFVFMSLDPNPENYFFTNFGKYPATVFSLDDSEESYFTFLNMDPGESPADALIFNSERYIIKSISSSWFAYGERRSELGILKIPPNLNGDIEGAFPFHIVRRTTSNPFKNGRI